MHRVRAVCIALKDACACLLTSGSCAARSAALLASVQPSVGTVGGDLRGNSSVLPAVRLNALLYAGVVKGAWVP
jgi:hypothetical protein